jgi:hypothetical protein
MLNRFSVAIIGFLGLLSGSADGQTPEVGLDVGYATFTMTDLKLFQKELSRQYPVDASVVESFPGHLNFSMNLKFVYQKFYFGVVVGHTSTGGRISYADYSGSLSSDQLIRINYFGPVIAARLGGNETYSVFFGGNVFYYANNVIFREKIQISTETLTHETRLKSVNVATGPYLEVQKKIKSLSLRVVVGAELHITGPLSRDGSSDNVLMNSRDEEVNVQAGGLRLSFGMAYLLWNE